MEFDIFAYVWLPLMIFVARIFDVTIGTMRIILVSKGYKSLAPLLGFIEVLIWIVAIGQIMAHLDNWMCYLFYAAGFATGNYIGMLLEEKIALGIVSIRLVTAKPAEDLIDELIDQNYGLTQIPAIGSQGNVSVLYITIGRKKLKELIKIINEYNPGAFYTVEDIRMVNKGVFKNANKGRKHFTLRKGK